MKILFKAAIVSLVCLLASPLFAGDCQDVVKQIGPIKNNPGELRILLDKSPDCGAVWEALGDYFYRKQVWNEACLHYEQALKYMPGDKRISARLEEIRPKLTTLIKNERELLEYARKIGGTTDTVPQSFATPAPQPAPPPQAPPEQLAMARPVMTEKAVPAQTSVPASTKKSHDAQMKMASKDTSPRANSVSRAKVENIALMIYFEYNSAEITPESKKLLDGFVEVLNKELSGRKFVIQGHTDNKGSRDYNMSLSQHRAKAVMAYLAGHGVNPDRLKAKGFGFDKPIYDNATDAGRSKNRRVEFEEI